MDNTKGYEVVRRSLRVVNNMRHLPMKPLGVSNSQSSYERKSLYDSLQKSPVNARKTLFEPNSTENEDVPLCKDFFTNRENTGKSPVVVHMSKKSNGSQEKKKIKPRRSMLGLRSKTQLGNYGKDDITFTVSKPLQASSPNGMERHDNYNYGDLHLKPISQKSISTPQLTPFDSDDIDSSAFFNNGITSDSTWSVFKNNKKKIIDETPLNRRSLVPGMSNNFIAAFESSYNDKNNSSKGTKSSGCKESTRLRSRRTLAVSSVDQEVKLKWLAQKFQMEGNSNLRHDNSMKNVANGNLDDDSNSESKEEYSDHNEDDKLESTLTYSYEERVSPIEDCNQSTNSTDSYIQNETTILNSGINNLEKIEEESSERLDIVEHGTSDEESDDKFMSNIPEIISLLEDLRNEKEEMNSKLNAFMEQKEVFEGKLNALSSLIMNYAVKLERSQNNLMNNKADKKKIKKIISTKAKHCFISPKPYIKPGSKSGIEREIKKLRTPVSTGKKLRRFRKSGCYTPNSLSIMVDDQEKEIFGDI